jgi:glycosyltransferase involved in cell wall biosynthesis
MKIAIDARFLGPEGTGIGRYVEELVRELEKIDQINKYYVLLKSSNFDIWKPLKPNFHRVLADARWYTPKEQFLIPQVLRKINPDLTHFPANAAPIITPGKIVLTIHDLIQVQSTDISSSTKSSFVFGVKRLAFKAALFRSARRAHKIIVPTNAIKDRVATDLKIPADKIAVTYEAPDEKFFTWGEKKISKFEKESVLKKHMIKPPFLLYVGNVYPYKNLNRLVDALALLPKEISLACVGRRTPFHEKLNSFVKEKGLGSRVVMPGFVSDEDMAVLYHAAAAYAFPTLSEGFGLPAVEAMASRLPVVCSDIPVLKEVCGDNAEYFDPDDPLNIASKVSKVLNDRKLRDRLIKEGLERAHQFSWRKMAAQTLLIYEESRNKISNL